MHPQTDRLLPPPDVARLLDVSERTLEGWRARGGGPPYTLVGRLVRYSPAEVAAWLAERRRTSTSDSGAEAR
jgi:predicted DNA-binding transcriptional regulator AlpA